MSTLREERRQRTRDEIVEAVHRVLVDEHPAELSMPRVAEEAGVSLRTLYRYFPTKSDLVDAASRSNEVEVVAELGEPSGFDDVETYLLTMWGRFDEQLPAVLAQHATPAGRELRRQRLPRSRELVADAVDRIAPDLEDVPRRRLVDTIVFLTSSAAYLELTHHQGHSSEEAVQMTMTALGAVVAHTIGAQP